MISKRFFFFLLSGGIAALANFGSRILFSHWLPYAAAIVLAYLVGMTTAFVLMRKLAFTQTSNRQRTQVAWFVVVNGLAVLQTLVISLMLVRWVFPWLGIHYHDETLAHAIGVAVPVVTSYLGHKHLSFKN
ncbi:putative flippase GtrA [Xanthomonas campestris]|uniref:GtrA family protein n=1 Tax=Xanthomonas TaxID=338 RepID=UPI00141B9399|nr:GtrA family protein [Xanthomonas sp. CFBP 8151]NIJ75228.1 putative flippase GtrA [Xanthomonas sp. CFBP 8151]